MAMTSVASLTLLAALALGADPLADLQAALAKLTATRPVTARFTVRTDNVTGEGKDAVTVSGEVEGEVVEGPDGLQLRWGQSLVQRARDQERRRAASPEEPAPDRDGLAQLQAMDLVNQLDAARALGDHLSRATLLEEKEDLYDGAPARLLVLRLSPALQARERRYLREWEAIGRIWLGPDGLPLAAEARLHGRGRILLIISFETEVHQAWRFARVGDRLVAVRRDEERRWEGAGDRGERRSSSVLVLEAGARDR
jgi:hypothetical protein